MTVAAEWSVSTECAGSGRWTAVGSPPSQFLYQLPVTTTLNGARRRGTRFFYPTPPQWTRRHLRMYQYGIAANIGLAPRCLEPTMLDVTRGQAIWVQGIVVKAVIRREIDRPPPNHRDAA